MIGIGITIDMPHRQPPVSGQTVIILTEGDTWTVPADFNSANNTIEAIGGGGGGAGPMNNGDGRGGGGGAYAVLTNFDPEGEATIPYTIGGGGDLDADGAATTFLDGHTLLATYGRAVSPESGGSGGLGGLAADCVPTLGAHSGGDGYYDDVLGLNAGGGGAAGPDGDGQIADDEIGGDGGSPRGGAGGAAGMAGSVGTTWQDTVTHLYAGPGGGGGSAANGGQYGGGGGAGALSDGTGGDGVIVISYTPLPVTDVATNDAKLSLTGISVGQLVRVTGEGNRIEQYTGPDSTETAVYVDGAGTAGISGLYTARGTNNGKSYFNKIGQPDSVENSAIVWEPGGWQIYDAFNTQLYFSADDTADPWDATFTLQNGDAPAPTLRAVTQGELDAGVSVLGGGSAQANAAYTARGYFGSGAWPFYNKVGSATTDPAEEPTDSCIYRDEDVFIIVGTATADLYSSETDPDHSAFPWEDTFLTHSGTPPVPTVTRNDIASEANWEVVT